MPISRYRRMNPVLNKNELYQASLEKRGLRHVLQYKTFSMNYPTKEDMQSLEVVTHIWKLGDKYYKLAHEHYGDSTLWWVIAWFNQIPLDAQLYLGQVIYIPLPLERVLMIFEA